MFFKNLSNQVRVYGKTSEGKFLVNYVRFTNVFHLCFMLNGVNMYYIYDQNMILCL